MNDRPVMVINNEHGWLSMLPELHSHRSKPRNSKSPYRIASDECFGSGGEQDKAGSAAAADVCFGSKADIPHCSSHVRLPPKADIRQWSSDVR
jgi:hypothetical protein